MVIILITIIMATCNLVIVVDIVIVWGIEDELTIGTIYNQLVINYVTKAKIREQ